MLAPWLGSEAAANAFDTLLGSWRGSGQILLSDGRRERLTCNAYYTGGGSQLGMAIRCQSESSSVEIRSKLSQSGSRISGTWEERTFNASGHRLGQRLGRPDQPSDQPAASAAPCRSPLAARAKASRSRRKTLL